MQDEKEIGKEKEEIFTLYQRKSRKMKRVDVHGYEQRIANKNQGQSGC